MDRVSPRELRTAARVAEALVYAAGLAGVVAGALLFRDERVAFAIVAWVLTFVAGATLRLAAWGARALAELLQRSERMEADLGDLVRSGGAAPDTGGKRADPWRRWGGWH